MKLCIAHTFKVQPRTKQATVLSLGELELELIQTQMTQKSILRAEGGCACVAQMARAKIKGVGGQTPYKERGF
jgi:hypothetical protein